MESAPGRYAAQLLFVYERENDKRAKALCERKIFVYLARSATAAYEKANQIGKEEEFSFEDNGHQFSYSFLGVAELIAIEDEREELVWCAFEERQTPRKRIGALIPKKDELAAFKPVSGRGKIKLL